MTLRYLVTSDPVTAPARFVAGDASWPPSRREPVTVIPADEWDTLGRPDRIFEVAE